MQQRSGTPPPPAVAEPSRRRPPRQRLADPVPIPEATTPRRRPARTRPAPDQQAIEERLEDGLLRIQEAVALAARTAVTEAAEETPPTDRDPVRASITHAEERFRALELRFRKVEDALRALTAQVRAGPPGPELDRVAALLREIGRRQGETMAKLARAHHAAIERLAEHQRARLDDLGRRVGRGVVAVAEALRQDLEEELKDLRISVRSMHRTLAWDGMTRGRPDPAGEP